jgi:proline dehydrogenase
VKGAYDEPVEDAYPTAEEVDLAYVRGLKILMAGDGYPMVGSHDPRLIAIAGRLAADHGRPRDGYEHQMLFGIRPEEQRRLVADGHRVRVYIPYGVDWYGYFARRLAERPANMAFFLRAMATRG